MSGLGSNLGSNPTPTQCDRPRAKASGLLSAVNSRPCASGGTADTLGLGLSAFGRAGSTPASRTWGAGHAVCVLGSRRLDA